MQFHGNIIMQTTQKLLSTFTALAVLTTPSWAQDTASEPALQDVVEPTQENVRKIDEIVVTATKRAENVRDVAASITALQGDELEERGAQEVSDIVKLVPGVNLTSTGDTPPRVTIRGISADIGTSSTTGILFGNMSFSDTYAPFTALDPNPFDIASVEILKGPQGTLYGASALNGAVRYVPNGPVFDSFGLKYYAQYQSIQDGDAQPNYGAAINVPIVTDRLALRVMGFKRIAPGYIDNINAGVEDANETEQTGFRAILGWQPNNDWDIQLSGAWQSTIKKDSGIVDDTSGTLETRNRPRLSRNENEYHFVDLSISYDFGWAELVSDTSYVYKEADNFFDATSRNTGQGDISMVAQYYTGQSDTYGQELRLVSPGDATSKWKWTAGLFAWQQKIYTDLTVPLAFDVTPAATIIDLLATVNPDLGTFTTEDGSPIVLRTAGDVEVTEYAAFGEVTREFWEQLEVSLGGRFYKTTSGGQNIQSGTAIFALQGSSPYTLEEEVKEKGFNPKASIMWHITDDLLVYTMASKGFRVGGVQYGLTTPLSTNSQAPTTFKSDTLWNYEAGIRTQWFSNTLRIDLTGFYVDWINPQSLQLDGSGVILYLDNVGGVESKGIDASFQYLFPWAGITLTSSYSYAKTVTTEPFDTPKRTVPAGERWPLAPEWQTATTLSFLQPIGDWALAGGVTYTAIGDTIPFFDGHEIYDYHQWDAQISFAHMTKSWFPKISLIFNNINNSRGLTNAFTSGVPTPDTAAWEFYYLTPRNFTLRISGEF